MRGDVHSVGKKDFVKNDTNFLRSIAILLIINSHLDEYYPIPYLGTGGTMGNTLFFVLSSFGLLLSERKYPRLFAEWYTRRIKRIYPTVWIVLILLTLPYKLYINAFDIDNILTFFGYFFYPPFWFLQLLMIFYFAIFLIIKKYSIRKFYCILIALSALYAFIYLNYLDLSIWCIEDNIFTKFICCFMLFVFGVYLADRKDTIQYSGLQDWGLLFLSVFIIYGHKFLMLKNMASSFQFIQQLFLFPFTYYFFKVSRSGLIQKNIMELPIISSIINYISDMTLELYLVHLYVSIFILKLKLFFPMNIVIFLIVTFIISDFVKFLSKIIFSRQQFSKNII
jgi:peptidoglycan/LPS O-acetylase OafA/YrhL